jgi:hypothetical protein
MCHIILAIEAEARQQATMALAKRVIGAFTDYDLGSTANQVLHDWRCRYPDTFGHCTCVVDWFIEAGLQDADPAAKEATR